MGNNKTSINELSDELTALRGELKDLKKQEHNNIKTISLECAEYRNKSEKYFQDNESNKEKISEYLNIFQPKLEDIANVDNHIRELNKSSEELKNKINDFESIINEYKDKFDIMFNELNNKLEIQKEKFKSKWIDNDNSEVLFER